MTAHVVDDGRVDIRAANSLRTSAHNLATRDDGDVSRATADIDNSRSTRLIGADAATERGRESFLNHSHATDVCVLRSTEQCASLHGGDVGKHTHQRATAEMRQTAACFANKVGQHFPGSLEV